MKGVSHKQTEQISFLCHYYERVSNRQELTNCFNQYFNRNYTVNQIRYLLRKHQIVSGRSGRFVSGHVPWTVRCKGTGLVKGNSGSFRAGNIPKNRTKMYAERVRKDGYIEIKVAERNPYTDAPTRYRLKHGWLWEKAHGQLSKGKCIVFIDGDKTNCVLSNFMEISKSAHLRRNSRSSKTTHRQQFSKTLNLLERLKTEAKRAKKRI